MALNKLFLLGFLISCMRCNGQETTGSQRLLTSSRPAPIVIRHSKAEALSPGLDTTRISQYIRSIFQDSKGNMWFGTINDGVVRYNGKTLTYFSAPDGLISNSVFAINEDKKGTLWLGTDQGVYAFNGKTFRHYAQPDGLSPIEVSRKSILVDHLGTVWVGTKGGVFRYDPQADSAGRPCFSPFQLVPQTRVAGMLEDKRGAIWIATASQGVYRYEGSAMTHFTHKESLGDNYAGGLAEDNAGAIWFTMKNGICHYDGKTWTDITANDGLGGTEFWGIYIEQSGIIWVTARGNTTRFDPTLPLPNPKAFRVFTPADGLNCCVQSMYQDKSGAMWFGTGEGLYRFNGQQFYQVKQQGPW